MKFFPYTIKKIYDEVEDVKIFRAVPNFQEKIIPFKAGQFVHIINPSEKLLDPRPFSIASSPYQKQYLEFCIKRYGKWTSNFLMKREGDTIFISNAKGNFVWDQGKKGVFLLGGIGISPVVSILRYLEKNIVKPDIKILYGNRTPKTIAYKSELERISRFFKNFGIVNIFSEKSEGTEGYSGFITKEIVKNEVKELKSSTFYVIGPPIFVLKMNRILKELRVPLSQIKQELISELTVKKSNFAAQNGI